VIERATTITISRTGLLLGRRHTNG